MAIFFVTAVVLLLDQGSKLFFAARMEFHESIPVINNIFHITLIKNYGAAFGILPHMRVFFIAVTILVILLIIYFIPHVPRRHLFLRLGLALQLGGALGNLVDRVRMGYIIDFLDFRIWPVFNVADTAIVVGVFFMALDLFRMPVPKED